jgi:hypothetical protein
MMSWPRTLTNPSTVLLRRFGSEWIARGSAISSNICVESANHSAPMRKTTAESVSTSSVRFACAKCPVQSATYPGGGSRSSNVTAAAAWTGQFRQCA